MWKWPTQVNCRYCSSRPTAGGTPGPASRLRVWGVRGFRLFSCTQRRFSVSLHIGLAASVACFVCLFAVPVQSAQTIEPLPSASQVTVPTIEVRELQTLIKEKAFFFLLDVRQPEEFAQGHIEGAVLMPLGSLPDSYQRIPKGVQLVVYCRAGHRSAQAVSFLLAHGYDKAVSLSGGYAAWSSAQQVQTKQQAEKWPRLVRRLVRRRP